jgi:serine phosphatase RsbU (regulator of sigma subunit)
METVARMDEALGSSYGGEAFTTALVAELELDTGRLRWVNAGHPAPLLLRANRVVKHLDAPHLLPLGLNNGSIAGAGEESVLVENLEAEDNVLLYTDGAVEGRASDGTLFGIERLTDLVGRNLAGGLPPAETMRRLTRTVLAHQGGRLRDDASLVLVHWPNR